MDNLLTDQLLRVAVDSANSATNLSGGISVANVVIALGLAIGFFLYLNSNL